MNLLKNILELNRMKNWKEDRLKIIKEILPALGDNFYLKGGTALLFYYGLDRFSEDIDKLFNFLFPFSKNKINSYRAL